MTPATYAATPELLNSPAVPFTPNETRDAISGVLLLSGQGVKAMKTQVA